jgi:hypothetical protein
MALDLTPIAKTAARFFDELEEEYGPDADLVRLAIVVEIEVPGDGDEKASWVHTRGHDVHAETDDEGVSPTVRAGLIARALAAELGGD